MERKSGKGRFAAILGLVVLAAALTGCGGGSAESSSAAGIAGTSFQWEAPTSYVDNTPLDPTRSIDRYEVFVTTAPDTDPSDEPIACVSANTIEGAVARPVNSFNLNNLSPFLTPGAVYYESVRAVGIDNQASERSLPLEWCNEA